MQSRVDNERLGIINDVIARAGPWGGGESGVMDCGKHAAIDWEPSAAVGLRLGLVVVTDFEDERGPALLHRDCKVERVHGESGVSRQLRAAKVAYILGS